MYSDAEIVSAFNQHNEVPGWKARASTREAEGTIVTFDNGGIISLIYQCDTGRFNVRFNRFQSAWGDYLTAISRAVTVVRAALNAAALTLPDTTGDEDTVRITCSYPAGTVEIDIPLRPSPSDLFSKIDL